MKGVSIPGFRISKEGKVEPDHAARRAKLPVNKQIAARESAKSKVKFVRKNHGAG
jgi:hypothetical protein